MDFFRKPYVGWAKGGEITAREFYDHQTDPQENQNLIESADPALLKQLAAQSKAGWKAAKP
ncbi:MAG: hypothetical protein H8M99_01930 [Gloeobacteraceae cyanobacterium ES-bin-144]|nr:hypothetical protein [Verrucomicrobiales bacterium]